METQEVQDKLRSYFDQADSNSNGLLDEGELPQFIDNVDNLYSEMENEEDDHDHGDLDEHSGDDHGDHDEDMPEDFEFEFAFNNQGEIEFFRMDTGDGSLMTVYMLSDSKVEDLTSSSTGGEAVALPFVLSDEPMEEPFTCDNGEEMTIPMKREEMTIPMNPCSNTNVFDSLIPSLLMKIIPST
jgi:hypothetical protein